MNIKTELKRYDDMAKRINEIHDEGFHDLSLFLRFLKEKRDHAAMKIGQKEKK